MPTTTQPRKVSLALVGSKENATTVAQFLQDEGLSDICKVDCLQVNSYSNKHPDETPLPLFNIDDAYRMQLNASTLSDVSIAYADHEPTNFIYHAWKYGVSGKMVAWSRYMATQMRKLTEKHGHPEALIGIYDMPMDPGYAPWDFFDIPKLQQFKSFIDPWDFVFLRHYPDKRNPDISDPILHEARAETTVQMSRSILGKEPIPFLHPYWNSKGDQWGDVYFNIYDQLKVNRVGLWLDVKFRSLTTMQINNIRLMAPAIRAWSEG